MPIEKTIGIVKKKLWAFGYNVRTVYGLGLGCDLIVEGKYRVRVFNKGVPVGHPNDGILAIVSKDAAKRSVVVYSVGDTLTASPRDMFGLPKSKEKNHGKKIKSEGKEGATKAGA